MKTKVIRTLLLLILPLLILPASLYSLTIKIGSIAPVRSPWDKALRQLGQDWSKITEGKVKLKIYAGGIAGSENDMIRKMRMGILGGAALTNRGMIAMYPDVYVLNIPFLLDSDEELNYVFDKMKGAFEKGIEEKGFKVIIWSLSGWLKFFSKDVIVYPEDLKKHKLSYTTGEPKMEQAWKQAGYHIVPNEFKDMMMALQSGMVNAFYLPPLLAASSQYFPLAPNMCDLKVAPLFGGIVLSERTWKRIPDKYKEPMMKAAAKTATELYRKTVKLEKEAIEKMKEHDLKIHQVPPDAVKKWREASDKGMNSLVGKAFSKEIYEQVLLHVKEYRKLNGTKN